MTVALSLKGQYKAEEKITQYRTCPVYKGNQKKMMLTTTTMVTIIVTIIKTKLRIIIINK